MILHDTGHLRLWRKIKSHWIFNVLTSQQLQWKMEALRFAEALQRGDLMDHWVQLSKIAKWLHAPFILLHIYVSFYRIDRQPTLLRYLQLLRSIALCQYIYSWIFLIDWFAFVASITRVIIVKLCYFLPYLDKKTWSYSYQRTRQTSLIKKKKKLSDTQQNNSLRYWDPDLIKLLSDQAVKMINGASKSQ